MAVSLRQRVFLTQLPLLLLLAVLGTAAILLLARLGSRIDVILRENYDTVLYMERLHEALERIDSSFQFALAGRPDLAHKQYDEQWRVYRRYLEKEQNNITLPGEGALVAKLAAETEEYRKKGDAFYELPEREWKQAYFGGGPMRGLYDRFTTIKHLAEEIRQLNQDNMEQASRDAKQTAADSIVAFSIGLTVAALLAVLAAWHTLRSLLYPIRALTSAVQGIAAGNLDQVVPAVAEDELGQLALAFNTMARRLRDYRRSQSTQLQRAQQASQATIDSFPDPVVLLDTEGIVEMANPAARRLLGAVPRSSEGVATPASWQPPEALRQPLQLALHSQRDFLPEGFEHTLVLGSGGLQRTFLPRILTVRSGDGELLGAAMVLQDVTPLRLLDEVKSNLVATVSHELKTPLTSIRLALHLLLDETVGPLGSKQVELLLDARENSERLLAMVNNLLNLARLEGAHSQLEIQRERPEALLRAAADAIRPRAQDKDVELIVEAAPDLPPVAADPVRFGTALRNLVDNALAYTDRGGRITLSAAREGGDVVLAVADTGQGIPVEYLAHVFDKFFRVPGQSRAGGTGLGLAIVQEIVTAHGGTISCQSEPGHGTTFRITLPAAPQPLHDGSAVRLSAG